MRLKELRIQKGFTQKELANAINVDPSVISRFERGETTPSLDKVRKLAEMLDASVSDLIGSGERTVGVTIGDEQHLLSERVAELLRKIDCLDDLDFFVVENIIDTLYCRSAKKSVSIPSDSLIALPKTSIDCSSLFANSDNETRKMKTNTLRNLKRKSFLTNSNIHLLLAYRGYNHVISIQDIVSVFRGKREPGDRLYQDLIEILNDSLRFM